MSVSSHRKLNVEQLINLAQVYWDDPTKLMEIADASGGRVDPAAQLLAAAVNGRLNRLRSDPARALGEAPPDLAALIAARLGTSPKAGPGEPEEPQSAARAAGEEGGGRRRLALAAVVLLLVALGAWWFWPRADEEAVAVPAREIGIKIKEGGLAVLEEEEKASTTPGLPPGRRRPQLADLEHEELPEIEATDADVDVPDPAAARVREPPAAAVRESATESRSRVPREPGPSPAHTEGGEARAGGAARAAAVAATAARAVTSAAGARPSAGVEIAEGLLQCYLTDSRPSACAPAGGGGATASAAPAGGPAAASDGSGGVARSQARVAASAGGGSGAGSSASGGGERGRGSGSGGAASGSGGAAGDGSPGGGAPAKSESKDDGESPAASAPAGGDKQKAATPPAAAMAATPDPECPEAPPQGRVVFVFDGSISMGLPLGVPPAEEDRLDQGVLRRDPEARRQYRALLQQPGPKRMGRAQDAFADAAAELPETVQLGLVVFQECRDIRKVGLFEGAARAAAIDYVDQLVPRGRTPLAQSLASAAEMLGDGPSSIVVLTDGIEFCRGDPCAAATQIKAAHPKTPVHIIDVTGQARTACVAEITGGRSYAPPETDDLAAVLRAAFRGAAPRCAAAR